MRQVIRISGRSIGLGLPTYVVAELSANHGKDFGLAVKTMEAAKNAGADAIKLQTYTPDTLTMASDKEEFHIRWGTPWDGRTLYELYGEAYTPWEWQPRLQEIARDMALDLFSTAFDPSAVDYLEKMDVPLHKIASFEIVDIPLIQKMARTGKPLLMSTGMATLAEIEDAVQAARGAGATEIALLKCTSAYPAPPEEMNLRTIPHLAQAFHLPVGLSDHSLGIAVPSVTVALGACIVEKHFTLSRDLDGPDSSFSLEPQEFKAMVEAIRTSEKSLGEVHYGVCEREAASRPFRRSLFVVKDIKAGEVFTEENVRSIRPALGLPPKLLPDVLGRRAARDIDKGTPLTLDLLSGRMPTGRD